jgi:hypothetical protein
MSRPTTSRSAAPTPLTVRTPEDVLAAVPVVLGFEPRSSVVMLTFGGAETFHARADLPPPEEADDAVDSLLEPARRHRVERVVFVVYADDGPAARTLVRRLRRAFVRAGIAVLEVLRVHDGRWFAPGQAEVPRHGVPYDVTSHRFRAQAVLDGIVVQRSRAEVAALLRPLPEAVGRVAWALRRAVPSPPGEIADLVDLRLGSGHPSEVELAGLLLGLCEAEGRDAALAAMSRDNATDHVRLWTDAVQRAPTELVAAPAALLGVAAWLAGQGALAWCAVDCCRAVEPGSSLAALVAEVLDRAVPPSAWAHVTG